MRKDINGRSYFTPHDVNPPMYLRVKHSKGPDSLGFIIFGAFIVGLIITAVSL